MTVFLASVAAFISTHVILPIPALRNRLIGLLGRRVYLIGYSLLSTVLLIWVILAATAAPYVELWPPRAWQALLPLIAIPIAIWLLIAGLTQPNPLSISLRSADGRPPGPIVSITRHPVLWAFFLWSATHTVANGDVVSLIMFGGLSVFAVAGFWLVDFRYRRRLGIQQWSEVASRTSTVPFAAALSGRAILSWNGPMTLAAIATAVITIWFVNERPPLADRC